ncbi:MAG: phage tail tape measure protein [Polaromonas sp.]
MSTTYTVGVKIDGSAAGLAKAAKDALATTKQLGAGSLKEFQKMAQAREALGIRPERQIQREIERTQAAYNRLARSGTASFNDQRRAAMAARDEITKLTNEMGRLTGRQRLMQAGGMVRNAAVATGIAAALVKPTVQKTMAYDLRLAYLANTGYADSDKAGRQAGRNALDAKITGAVRYGGGTRDSALDTLDLLLGSGIFKPGEIDPLLRESTKAATANNANPANFAQMAIAANQTMGIKPEQMARMFGMATFAGQSGGFEIKDMAKWLSQQMAAAKSVGMYGEAGFAKLAALNQAAVVTAGTKDEAGNNVVNLLAKLGSQDTVKDFKKLGVDLPKQLAEGRMKGMDAIDVVGNLLQTQLGKDKNYQRVQKELLAAKNDAARTEKLKAVGDIAQGTLIGKVFQDRQALMGLVGYMNAQERVGNITTGAMANADTAVNKNFDLVSDTASYKADQAIAARDIAFQKSMDKMMPALGGVADGLTNLMTQYPGYTTAIAAATAAVAGLTGAAGFAALALGRGAGGAPMGGLPGGAGGKPGAAGAARAGAGAGGMLKGLGAAGRLLGPLAMAAGAFYTSDEDIQRLLAYEARQKGGGGNGIRGSGFNDPRLIGGGAAAGSNALQQALRATEVRGEISVRVTAAPGLNVQTDLKSNSPRIPMKAALGQTNLGAGY